MSDLNTIWEQVAHLHSDTFGLEVLQKLRSMAAWDGNSTFHFITPKLQEERVVAPDFYKQFNYDWTLNSSNYEYPQDILFQYFALQALTGAWYSTPQNMQNHPAFEKVGTRTLAEWGMRDGLPRARNPVQGWRIIILPYVWYEFSSTAISGYLSCVPEPIELSRFNRLNYKHCRESSRRFWDAMLIKGLIGQASCHEILRPGLADILSNKFDTSTFLPAANIAMRPEDVLTEFALRFTTAHEVGHHLSSVYDQGAQIDSELLADQIAANAMHAVDRENTSGGYSPVLDKLEDMPVVAAQTFFFVCAMWISVQNAIERVAGKSENLQSRRTVALNRRIYAWRTWLHQYDPSMSKSLEDFFTSLLEHVVEFQVYADSRSLQMYEVAAQEDQKLIESNPATDSYEGIERWLHTNIAKELPPTLTAALKKLET